MSENLCSAAACCPPCPVLCWPRGPRTGPPAPCLPPQPSSPRPLSSLTCSPPGTRAAGPGTAEHPPRATSVRPAGGACAHVCASLCAHACACVPRQPAVCGVRAHVCMCLCVCTSVCACLGVCACVCTPVVCGTPWGPPHSGYWALSPHGHPRREGWSAPHTPSRATSVRLVTAGLSRAGPQRAALSWAGWLAVFW